MKDLAARTNLLAQSDIRAITRLVNEYDGINLGQGICDLPTPDPIKEGAISAIENNQSIYTNYAGIRPLREAILKKAQTFNKLPAEHNSEVMVSIGSTGAFVSTLMTLFEAGDEVILFEPFYGYHKNILNLLGVNVISIPMRGINWEIDFEEVHSKITSNTKAVLVNTPGNPSGKVWTKRELETTLNIATENDLWIITDEIYEYMTYDGNEHISLASLPGAWDRTITLSGFSKTYNMTGWRLGYAIGPAEIIGKMGLINDLLYICAPAPLQNGVTEAFSMAETYFTEMMVEYNRRRTLMCETLEQIGFEFVRPAGAYYVLASFKKLKGKVEGFDNDQMACETLVRKAGVGTIPGKSFFDNPESGDHLLRFCYAKEIPILETACRRLIEAFG